MNTMMHLAGILATVWLAYVCFSVIGGDDVKAQSETVANVGQGHPSICVEDAAAFAARGTLRIDGDYYEYSTDGECRPLPGGNPGGDQLTLGKHVLRDYAGGDQVAQVVRSSFPQARYLGWAFVVMSLLLLPALVIAMKFDYMHPVREDT